MKTLVFLLVVLIIGAVIWYYMTGQHAKEPVTEQTTVIDTMVIVKDSIINANAFDTIPSRFYQGMLPCQNCEGIQRTIMFSGDDHYKMEELDWGKGTQARKSEGTWEKRLGRFLLYRNNKVVAQYRLSRDSLINTESNSARIPDSLSKQYALYKKNPVPENLSWRKRKSEGIDMIGNGSEPFWSVEIDNEKLILFRLAAAEKPIIVPIEKPVITRDSTIYSIVTEAGATLKISVSSKFCSDGVSDHLYEYKMTVWYKDQVYKGCAVVLANPN